MPYCMYLRKSRADLQAEAHGEGDTLLRHEKALFETAKKKNLELTEVYREIVSGETISDRPEMRRLLSDVSDGKWDGVLVMEIERLARGDTSDQGTVAKVFRFSGTPIITPSKTYNPENESDEEYLEFGLFMSRREYKTVNRRLQYGRFASVKEGKYAGSKPPFGYRREKIQGDKGFTLIPDEKTCHIVKNIFRSYINGEGSCVIASRLNKNLAPSPAGLGWTSQNVLGVLKNPTYAGKVVWDRRKTKKNLKDGKIVRTRPTNSDYTVRDGLHEALISQEDFNKAEFIRKGRRNVSKVKSAETKNALAGLIRCGVCGHSMVKKVCGGKLLRDTLLCPYGCGNVSCGFDGVEAAILSFLCEAFGSRKIEGTKENSCDDFREGEFKRITSELENSEKCRERLCELLESGVYSREIFTERQRKLQSKTSQLKERLSELSSQKEETANVTIPDGISDIARLSCAGRNACYKTLMEKVVYRKEVRGENAKVLLDIFLLV